MGLVSDDRTVTVGVAGGQPEGAEPAAADELPVVEQANYQLRGEHARGGLGRIVAATDKRLGRTVAVKELLRVERRARARFVREAKITARLQHPGIVPIYEAGTWPSGAPFYAMKMVSGEPLSGLLAAAEDRAARLALLRHVRAVAETVAYAHSEGVIHRDLKPSNVIVGEFGETIVVDWGLAKDLRDTDPEVDVPGGPYRKPERADATMVGSVLGTPAYMPPEQARGEAVDERADVYALGAMLYHVLAGRPPYRGDTSDAVVDAVVEGPPPPLPDDAAPDLAAIANRAMARDPADRYDTAAAVAADIERYETGQLVSAHTYSAGALIRRWLRRHRAIVAVVVLALVALAIGGTVSFRRVVKERTRAQHNEKVAIAQRTVADARANALVLERANDLIRTDPTSAIDLLREYPEDGADWDTALDLADQAVQSGVADVRWTGFESGLSVVEISADGTAVAVGTAAGDVEYLVLAQDESRHVATHEVYIVDVSLSADGKVLAAADVKGGVSYWRAGSAEPVTLADSPGPILDIELRPDGELLAIAFANGTVGLWTPRTNELVSMTGHTAQVISVQFLPDPAELASISDDGTARLWTVPTGSEAQVFRGHEGPVSTLTTTILATGGQDGTVRVWDKATGEGRVVHDAGGIVFALASSETGVIASGTIDGRFALVDPSDGTVRFATKYEQSVNRLEIAGAELIVTTNEHATRVMNLDNLDVRTLRGHRGFVSWSSISANTGVLATLSADRTVRVWDATQWPSKLVYRSKGMGYQVDAAPDGSGVVATFETGEIVHVDIESGELTRIPGQARDASIVRYAPNSRTFAVAYVSGRVTVFDDTASPVRSVNIGVQVRRMEYHPDSAHLVFAGVDDSVHIWSFADPATRRFEQQARYLALSPTGHQLAGLDGVGEVTVRDTETGKVLRHALHPGAARIAFSPDGDAVLTAGSDGVVQRWPVNGGEPTIVWRASRAATVPVLAASGRVAAVPIEGGGMVVADLEAQTARTLPTAFGTASGALLPNDAQLLAQIQPDRFRVWALQSDAGRSLLGHSATVFDMDVLGPHGAVSVGRDGELRVWTDVAAKQRRSGSAIPVARVVNRAGERSPALGSAKADPNAAN